ncbi:hypothetical protein PS3A_38160 [Pseudomonas sp. 3A(2025)]
MDALAIKTVSLTFRGFDEDVEKVIALMGVGTDDVEIKVILSGLGGVHV